MPAVLCLISSNVQITKYLDVPNLCQKNWKKSRRVQTGPNFISTLISAKLPIFQIYHIHFHTLGDRSRQSICWRQISLDVSVRARVTKCKPRHIFGSMFAKISNYLLKMGGWNESGTIWMKNIYGTKLKRPFRIAAKFVPNKKFGRRNLNIWTDRRITAGTQYLFNICVSVI